jgi:hypothetical protein
MRASAVVNCQITLLHALLRRSSQAATSRTKCVPIWNPPFQALRSQNGEFALGDVEPAAVFGRVMPFEARCQAMGFFRLEGFIERTWPMGVQVVNDQNDALGLRIIFVREQAQLFGKVTLGAPCRDAHPAPPPQGFDSQEEIGNPVPFVFVVLPQRLTRLKRQAATGSVMQFFAGLIQTNNWPFGVVGPLIDVQHVFHLGNVRPRGLADTPRLYPPGLDLVFFSSSPTVTWLIEST